MLGGSGFITNNTANKGVQGFDYGLLPLHSTCILHYARPKIVDASFTLILGGSDIVTNNIGNKGSR